MEPFAIGLFAVAVIGIPIAILLFNDYGKKRVGGASPLRKAVQAVADAGGPEHNHDTVGRQIVECGNRDICYRKKKNTQQGGAKHGD